MRYKLIVEGRFQTEGINPTRPYTRFIFPVELDTSTGPQLKDDASDFFDHYFPRDNEQMFLNDADRKLFIQMYDEDVQKDFAVIEKCYYKEADDYFYHKLVDYRYDWFKEDNTWKLKSIKEAQ